MYVKRGGQVPGRLLSGRFWGIFEDFVFPFPVVGCKRKFTLMKEDYIMLKFSLENPIYFKLGSYVECNFGLFEVCDLQKPAFNTNTAGYDYELRLDAYY